MTRRYENRRPKTLSRRSIHLFETRLRWIIACFVILMIISVGRAFQYQILEHRKWAEKAAVTRTKSKDLAPPRGPIFDRDDQPLAISRDAISVQANTYNLTEEDIKKNASTLARIFDLDKNELEAKFKKPTGRAWIKRDVTDAESEFVLKAGLRGVSTTLESVRSYPSKSLAANVLGCTGEGSEGLEGIEYIYNKTLLGKAGRIIGIKDLSTDRMIFPDGVHYKDRAPGGSVKLTIDSSIQHFTELALAKGWKRTGAKSAMALVMDPNSGEILAMAQHPTFDPNDALNYERPRRCNLVVTTVFEPGSTLKPFIIAGALNAGAITPDDYFDCGNGKITIGKYTVRDTHPHSILQPRMILVKSSNICAFRVADKTGPESVYKTLVNFGFGSKSNVGLGGESGGILHPYNKWGKIGLSNIAFGQGIAVNCLQMTAAFSALVNGGILIKPYIVAEVRNGDGLRVEKNGTEIINEEVIRPAVSEMVTDFLTGVVKPEGTGTAAALDEYTVAGKTGTTQKIDKIRGGYSKTDYIGSFIGAVPAEKPQVVILVVVDEPKGLMSQKYGGASAGPIFKEIAERIMAYYTVSGQAPKPEPNLLLKMAHKNTAPVVKKKRAVTTSARLSENEYWDINDANLELANALQKTLAGDSKGKSETSTLTD